MHSSRMRTARSLTVSPYLVVSHACPPGATTHAPPEQPHMPPQGATMHTPPGATTHAPPEQLCMPPGATMHAPPGATMHAPHPPGSNHTCPLSNHTCPPRSNHACPRATTHAPRSNHTTPPGATMHAPPGNNHTCPPEQPCTPLEQLHMPPPEQPCMPPGATMHTPRSNHACPPSNHAPPQEQPRRGGSPCPETPPVNRITHTCKNITLATTSLGPVKIWNYSCTNVTSGGLFSSTLRGVVKSPEMSQITLVDRWGGGGGRQGCAPPRIQILSFSWSFCQKIAK